VAEHWGSPTAGDMTGKKRPRRHGAPVAKKSPRHAAPKTSKTRRHGAAHKGSGMTVLTPWSM